jgi:hypothetical protein
MHFSTFAVAVLPLMAGAVPSLNPRQTTTKITVDLTKKYQTMDGFGIS